MKNNLICEISDKNATIEFYHEEHNSMTLEMLSDLASLFDKLSNENRINTIILKSKGEKTFCAGANFNELKKISTFEEGKEFFSGFGNVILSMKNCSKLIVGRVQGKAVGGGMGLISACDIAFATEMSSLRLSELSIGIGPFVIALPVIRKIGIAAFSDLTLNPKEWKEATWAKEKGLFSKIFRDIESLDNHIENYIIEFAKYSQSSLVEIKKLIWHGTDHWPEFMNESAGKSGKLVLDVKFDY